MHEYCVDLYVKYATREESEIRDTLLPIYMLEWLEAEVGERDVDWIWLIEQEKFAFKTEQGKVKFILRWL